MCMQIYCRNVVYSYEQFSTNSFVINAIYVLLSPVPTYYLIKYY